MKQQQKKILKIAVPTLFYGLLLVFLVAYLRTIDFSKLQSLSISWEYILVATLFGIAFRYWGTFIWLVLLRGLGATGLKASATLIYVYAKSWMGRYIPGTAPWILGKIYFASQHGISKNKLAVSSLLEGALQIAVLMTFSFAVLIFDTRLNVIDGSMKLLMTAVLIGCIIAMIPSIFNRFVSIAYKLVRKKTLEAEHLANGSTILKGAGLYAIGAVMNGFSLFFIAKAVYPDLGYENLLFVMGAGTLAGAASMLAIFAPSGIGVREGIQLVLLSAVMPTEFALIVTVITRLWGIGVDLLFFASAKVWVVLTKPGK